jgi:hypothetical protein
MLNKILSENPGNVTVFVELAVILAAVVFAAFGLLGSVKWLIYFFK